MPKQKTKKLKVIPNLHEHFELDAKKTLKKIAKRKDLKGVVVMAITKDGQVDFNRSLTTFQEVCFAKALLDSWIGAHFDPLKKKSESQ